MKKTVLLIYILAIVKLVLPFLLQDGTYELHRDEMLYLAEGSHMAWGFMEVPPLLSVFSWLIHLCGDGLFWVKFWPSLFGALTFVITARIILLLGGHVFAILLGFVPFIFGGYLRVHFLFQPNALEFLAWSCIIYTLMLFIKTGKSKWLYWMAVCCGLGMLSKYSVAFLIIGLLVGLSLTRQRKIFADKRFYIATGIALVIFLPNLIWQFINHFPVIYHMNELQRTQLQYLSPGNFLASQVVMTLPCCFIWITGLFTLFFVKRFREHMYIGIAYLTVIALLLAGHGKSYYALGAYPVLFAFGACELEQITLFRFSITRYIMIAIPLLLGYWTIRIALPTKPPEQLSAFYGKMRSAHALGILKWEDGKDHPLPQDFADMLGWNEMAQKAGKVYGGLTAAEKSRTLVFCDNYGQAGALNYYRNKYGLPVTYSDNASFLYWMPDISGYDNILLVTDDEQEMQHDFIKDFKSAVLADSVTSRFARERGDLIIMLKGMNEKMREMFREKIRRKKAKTSPALAEAAAVEPDFYGRFFAEVADLHK